MKKYRDCLHIPTAELIVYDQYGNEKSIVNKRLLDQQNAWSNLEKIKAKHYERILIYTEMENIKRDNKLLRLYDELCTELEFELQGLWKFDRDINFHMFWQRPQCSCPKLDNQDRYPHGHYIINDECPLHGRKKE